MKKIKLLAPILGMTALTGTVVPMVGCSYNYEKEDLEVSVVNTNTTTAESAQIKISDYSLDDDKNLILNITWTNPTTNAYYYPYLITVKIDNAMIIQKCNICPNGFTVLRYYEDVNGLDILIPKVHLKKGSKIEVDVDLEEPTSDYDFLCDDPTEIVFYGDKIAALQSNTRYYTTSYDTVWFAADASKYLGTIVDDQPIFIGAKGRRWDLRNITWISMDSSNIGAVFLGDLQLDYWIEDNDYSSYIEIAPPECGWTAAFQASSSLITGHYTFNDFWYNVTFYFGQEADEQ